MNYHPSLLRSLVLVLALATAMVSTAAEVLSNTSIIELQALNMGDAVIVEKINTSACNFDTSIAGLKSLKAANVSSPVIQAMMARGSSAPASAAHAAATPAPGNVNDPAAAHPPGSLWILQSGTMTRMETEFPADITHGGFIGPFGAGKYSTTARFTGTQSSLQLTTAKPEFYLYLGGDTPGELMIDSPTMIALAALKVIPKDAKKNADERAVDIATAGAYSSTRGIDRKVMHLCDPTKIGEGIYKLVPHDSLTNGEYAFCPTYAANIYAGVRGRFYTFGVNTGTAATK
jgi:hypothetical protein